MSLRLLLEYRCDLCGQVTHVLRTPTRAPRPAGWTWHGSRLVCPRHAAAPAAGAGTNRPDAFAP